MDNDVKTKANSIFNDLNKYLHLLRHKDRDDCTKCFLFGSYYSDYHPGSRDTDYLEEFDQKFDDLAKEKMDHQDPSSDCNFDGILADILWEEHSLGDELKHPMTQLSRLESEDSGMISEATESDSKDSIKQDDELVSNLSSDRNMDGEQDELVGSADSNFLNYTYWSVETGENVSTTAKATYFHSKDRKVSLLQESEAFVAEGFWGSDRDLFKNTPRHLLLQVTQIANRAFFDPDYRKYLQLNYV